VFTDHKFCWKTIEMSEQYAHIQLALKTLTQDEQDIVRLVVVEGASLRTAGKNLGVSAMTIQRRLKRALARLRDLLKSDQSA
jgi:RNA polymerase sigma-B factor